MICPQERRVLIVHVSGNFSVTVFKGFVHLSQVTMNEKQSPNGVRKLLQLHTMTSFPQETECEEKGRLTETHHRRLRSICSLMHLRSLPNSTLVSYWLRSNAQGGSATTWMPGGSFITVLIT